MPPAGFEPAIPASQRPQKHALDDVSLGSALQEYTHIIYFTGFCSAHHHSKKRLLATSCQSACLSKCFSAAPTERISMKFDIVDFTKIRRENKNLFKMQQKYWALYMKTLYLLSLLATSHRHKIVRFE